MKNKILTTITLLAGLSLATGCSEDINYPTEKTGRVALSSLGVEVENAETVIGRGRATVDLNPFIVTIYDEAGAQKEQWTYGQMPEIFELPVGKYKVDIKSHEVQKSEWDHPYFAGSREFEIFDGEITELENVVCKFASLKVTIRFTDELREAMGDDVQVKVVANDAGELVYTPDETRAGYFEVIEGSMTLAATFSGDVKGYNENFTKTYTDVAAGQHRIITFSLRNHAVVPDPETGYIDPTNGINVDTKVEDENIGGSVNPGEEPEEPGNRPGEEHFKENVKMEYAGGLLKVTAAEGLASLTLGLTTDNDELSTELAAVNGVDLAAPGAAASAVAAYGLPAADAVSGAKAVDVDFTALLAKAAEYTGTHAFIVSGRDTKGAASSFRVVAPGKVVEGQIRIESASLSFDEPNTPAEGMDGKVNITATNGIEKLEVEIQTTSTDFADAVSDLLPMKFDLAHPENDEVATKLGSLFPIRDAVIGKTELPFDITQFIPLLLSFEGEHKFIITVTDQTGSSESKTLTFVVGQ